MSRKIAFLLRASSGEAKELKKTQIGLFSKPQLISQFITEKNITKRNDVIMVGFPKKAAHSRHEFFVRFPLIMATRCE